MSVFETFYKAYRPKLRAFIRGIVPSEQAVDEVFDDVMMVVWDRIKDFEGRSKLSTWVYGIAYRRALKERKARREVELPEDHKETPDDGAETDGPLAQITTRHHLQSALGKLPDDQGSVVRLAYFEGLSYRDIGAIMDCPEDTVKTRMYHARRKLKASLGGTLADWI
jgi:RNA polymerase sigma-70 factor (ECF subfamily)